jgi:hypothetical protein
MGMTTIQEHLTTASKMADSDKVVTYLVRRETGDETRVECVAARMIEGKPLVLLQVNCRRIFFKKTLDFWNLIDTYNPDVIGTESWLSENICNAEVFRTDYRTFRRDRHTHIGEVFV